MSSDRQSRSTLDALSTRYRKYNIDSFASRGARSFYDLPFAERRTIFLDLAGRFR